MSDTTAEAIAAVVADLRAGRVRNTTEAPLATTALLAADATVVDCTAVYRGFTDGDKSYEMYEDTVLRPPWLNAIYGYVNAHGNVTVMHASVLEDHEFGPAQRWDSMSGTHVIDWDRVRWVYIVSFWVGGYSSTRREHIPTTGPLWTMTIAVYPDGEMADLRWINTGGYDSTMWDNAQVTFLQAVTFLNCRNVTVVEPSRPRAERRRLARTGVTVTELHVFAAGRTVQGTRPPPSGDGVPLTTVRGHLARYGPEHGRGLLFGKIAGVFWIPSFARGRRELGESEQRVVLHPQESASRGSA